MQSSKVFIDTSFFVSFIDRGDLNHLKTIAIFDFLGKRKYKVYSSSLVVTATFSKLEREEGEVIARDFLQAILESKIKVLYSSPAEFLSTFRLLKAGSVRKANISEIINATLMDKNGVSQVLTYDFWHNTMGTFLSELLNI
jgi:predicted nucleic acid-binding protein